MWMGIRIVTWLRCFYNCIYLCRCVNVCVNTWLAHRSQTGVAIEKSWKMKLSRRFCTLAVYSRSFLYEELINIKNTSSQKKLCVRRGIMKKRSVNVYFQIYDEAIKIFFLIAIELSAIDLSDWIFFYLGSCVNFFVHSFPTNLFCNLLFQHFTLYSKN